MSLLNALSYPKSVAQPVKSLVVLFHGYGANAADLLMLSEVWSPLLPSTQFVSLDAPYAFDQGGGRYWFTLEDYDMERMRRDITALKPLVENTLLPELKRFNLQWSDVILSGFSQGAALALALALYEIPVRGALSYAGVFLPSGEPIQKPFPEICMIHGSADDVVPLSFFEESKAVLQAEGVPFEGFVSNGLGHSIDRAGLEKGAIFLKRLSLLK